MFGPRDGAVGNITGHDGSPYGRGNVHEKTRSRRRPGEIKSLGGQATKHPKSVKLISRKTRITIYDSAQKVKKNNFRDRGRAAYQPLLLLCMGLIFKFPILPHFFPFHRAPADVAAEEAARPMDPVDGLVGAGLGLGDRGAQGGDA